MIYAGDVDYICNWLGNKKWVKALEWEGKENFNLAEDKPWNLTTGETMGRIRAYKNFKFLHGFLFPLKSWLGVRFTEDTRRRAAEIPVQKQ